MPDIAISYSRFSSPKQAAGDSASRQLEGARIYANQNNLLLDEALFLDRGRSAYTGAHVSAGVLGALIKRAQKNQLNGAQHLIVENPDRLSREKFSTAYPKVYQPLLSAGLTLHFISLNEVLRPEHTFVDLLRAGLEIDRAVSESAIKSERCGKAWRKKRQSANGKCAMTARAPAWLKADKGKPIEKIPERVAIVKQIFRWASQGLGAYAICDKLIAAGTPAWGRTRKGKPARWTPF
jgi:DNA invertase Pin-like site-specific DNA recombinase